MREYIITTDNNSDLPDAFYVENNLPVVFLSYSLNGKNYDWGKKEQSIKEFYDEVRAGGMPVTQQINPENCKAMFEPIAKEGKDILHIAFSSGLSGSYNSSCIAAEEIRELYPDVKVVTVDSLCASMGQGLLVYEALKRQKAGMSMEDLVTWLEEVKTRVIHEVVVEDLFHLQRGGRVSKAAAFVGSALGMKPVLSLNNEGKLNALSKQRGKNKALATISDSVAKNICFDEGYETVCITHSDCIEDAKTLEQQIKEKTKVTNVIISDIGPTIGAHTGCGTVAVFYFGTSR